MGASELCRAAAEVKSLMTPDPVTVGPDTAVSEVWLTMNERRFRHMLVVDEGGHLLGLVTQRDLLFAASRTDAKLDFRDERPVSEMMHRNLDTVRPECCAAEAARHMLRSKRSCLPVVNEQGAVVGVLTEADYLRLATRGAPPCTCGGVTPAEGSGS
jgi:CBS domain-containing protein